MRALIVSASSDIGKALATSWHAKGWSLAGTYRSGPPETPGEWTHCDLLDNQSVKQACAALGSRPWDTLVLAAGDLNPVGPFEAIDFDAWEQSLQINLLSQLRIVHALLPHRSKSTPPTILFFAGGGTNNATTHYSSYTLSKIALIKMCELLDAEILDTRFVILGPGLVDTKIHSATYDAGPNLAGETYHKVLKRLEEGQCVPMDHVVECCNWLVTTPGRAISGRNFSAASDFAHPSSLLRELDSNFDTFKLRRHNNAETCE